MQNLKPCEKCLQMIDIDKEMHVSLGTHQGKQTTSMIYFHFNCWKLYFEEKARQKAQAVVQGMSAKMIPMARQMISNAMGNQ